MHEVFANLQKIRSRPPAAYAEFCCILNPIILQEVYSNA